MRSVATELHRELVARFDETQAVGADGGQMSAARDDRDFLAGAASLAATSPPIAPAPITQILIQRLRQNAPQSSRGPHPELVEGDLGSRGLPR